MFECRVEGKQLRTGFTKNTDVTQHSKRLLNNKTSNKSISLKT